MLPPDISGTKLSSEECGRYARHLSLPELGPVGQRRLKASSVLCVGTGGLGSPMLLYLAAAGIGRIGLVDFDVVDASNLQRQVIHGSSWIGAAKVDSARARIWELNPRCDVRCHRLALSSDNALEMLADYDVICDGSDNFPTRYLVNDACVLLGLPWVYGSVFRFEGQTSVFNHEGGPDFRDLLPEPPPRDAVPSCAQAGVMGVIPGLIGMIQATETIKLITGIGRSLSGRLLVIDALSMRFRELKLQVSCSRAPIRNLIDYEQLCSGHNCSSSHEAEDGLRSISVESLRTLLKSPELARDGKTGSGRVRPATPLLLDVRTVEETAAATIPGSLHIPLADLLNEAQLAELRQRSQRCTLYVFCKKGERSAQALRVLRGHGIEGVNVRGGFDSWLQHGWEVSSPGSERR